VIKLILFDIDGTLVLTGGAGGRAMAIAIAEVFGIRDGFENIPMNGRTDTWIINQVTARHGIDNDAASMQRFHDVYIQHLTREVTLPGPRKGIMPGVRPLLDSLATRSDACSALLTGNLQAGARVKLEYFDLWKYFTCGAYGDNAPERNKLLGVALQQYEASGGGRIPPSDVVIIGDTPLDVAVAIAGGARSVAVATGSHTVDELRESGADVVLEDLSDLSAALAACGLK